VFARHLARMCVFVRRTTEVGASFIGANFADFADRRRSRSVTCRVLLLFVPRLSSLPLG
jgi:hypothetical protein